MTWHQWVVVALVFAVNVALIIDIVLRLKKKGH